MGKSDSESSSEFDEEKESDDDEGEFCGSKRRKVVPPSFKLKRHPCSCVCLPKFPLVAIADHKGVVSVIKYNKPDVDHVTDSIGNPAEPVRLKCVEKVHNSFFFVDSSEDSSKLVTAGNGRSILISDLSTEVKPLLRINKAHGSSISALCWYNENCVVTGDLKGRIKAFDIRMGSHPKRSRVFKFFENEDAISDFSGDSRRKYLLAASADSSMSAIDFRKPKFIMQSQYSNSGDMTSVFVSSNETKVVTGLSGGHVQIYEMGLFGVHIESLPIFEQLPATEGMRGLEKMCAINENIYAVSDDNGNLFAYSLFPNRLIATIGSHKISTECFDMDVTEDLLVSCGADRMLKFWDISVLSSSVIAEKKSKRKTKQQILQLRRQFDPVANFFADLE